MSEDLRNVFRTATAREPSAADSWAGFQSAKRRSTVVRTGVAVVGAVGAFIALILMLPGVQPGTGDNPINIGESISPKPPSPSKRYADAEGRFALEFPADWIGRGTANVSADFFPAAGGLHEESVLMDVTGGGDAPVRAKANGFFIRVNLRHAGDPSVLSDRTDLARRAAGGAAIKRGGIFGAHKGQNRVNELRIIYPAAPVEPLGGWGDGPPRYWCGGCIVEEVAITRASDIIEVLIVSPGQDLYNQYHDFAVAVLNSIENYTAPAPGESPDRL